MIKPFIIKQLQNIIGHNNVTTNTRTLDIKSTDALAPNRAFGFFSELNKLPDVVVTPQRTQDVSEVLKIATENKIPVIALGGGTGVMGGIVPSSGGIIIDMTSLTSMVELELDSGLATVQSGMVIGSLINYLRPKGYHFAHDPYSRAIATIGGAIATNGVGYTASKYGNMGEQVISLEVVLSDGKIITTPKTPTYSTGPNINNLFIGSEGTLGIITQATLKIHKFPEFTKLISFKMPSFEIGINMITEILRYGMIPTLLDLTEELQEVTLFLRYEGKYELVVECINTILIAATTFNSSILPEAIGATYWSERHSSALAYKQNKLNKPRLEKWDLTFSNLFEYLHISLPLGKILQYKTEADIIISSYDLKITEYCIWGKPQYFSMMVKPNNIHNKKSQENLHEGSKKLLELSCYLGGITEYCHGSGLKNKEFIRTELGEAYSISMRLKKTLDPYNILNPGKFL
jgi:FAD/FMN-containing dehydrogenase